VQKGVGTVSHTNKRVRAPFLRVPAQLHP